MVEKVIIQVEGNAEQVKPLVDQVEKLGRVDAANATQFKKTNEEFKRAQIERAKRLKEEIQDLNELKQAKKKAFSVEDIDAYNKRIAESERRIQTLKGETGKLGTFMKGQFAGIGAAIAGAFAVQQIISFGKEAVNLAAKGEGIRRAFAALNRADLLDNLRAATRNTVADIDLMAAAVKANNFKIPLEDLARYFKFAQQRARETGESVDYLVESIVLGIGRKSPLILDNLGISAVELRAKLKGIGTETASVGQISDAVGQIIDENLSKQGVMLDTTADKLARLSAGWTNFKEAAGIALVDIADFFTTEAAMSEEAFNDKQLLFKLLSNRISDINQGIGKDIEDASAKWADSQIAARKATEPTIETVGMLLEQIKELQEQYKDTKSAEEYNTVTNKIKAIQEKLEKIIGKTTEKIKEQKKELDKPVQLADALGGTLDVTDYEAKQKEINDLQQAGADEATRIKAEEVAERLRLDDLLAENEKKNQDEVTANLQEEARKREEIQQALSNAVSQLITMAIDYQLALDRQATDYKISLLQEQYNSEKITEEQFNQQRRAILKDQAEKEKEAAIIKATIDTANAVISSFADGGPVLAAIAAALGLAQIAIISATPIPQFEKGGKVKGKSHRDGGVHAELEGDEFIISKKAARKIGFDNLEMLNKGIVPIKLLKQSLSDAKNKNFETSMMKVFGSSDFDTYPIEKELRKNRKNDTELTHLLIKQISKGSQKRGGYA